MNFKKQFLKLGLIMGLTTAMIAPTVFASSYSNSSSVSIDMDFCEVNGAHNGVYHSLNSGSASFDGTMRTTTGNAHVSRPDKISLTLYKESGKYIGSVSARPSSNENSQVDISGGFGSVSQDRYYITAHRANHDNISVSIDGSISVD